ncbi:hypothetical protein HPP92_023748 [Vanilla planifolia]|uniref:Uncharacterized protein n=1 Tax=Vanilla planifolia TaxID=51239 RepID=A0A835UGJ7_VANPL|nr:hypothetical protein HPP92_023748 [Vanilla planifolia]
MRVRPLAYGRPAYGAPWRRAPRAYGAGALLFLSAAAVADAGRSSGVRASELAGRLAARAGGPRLTAVTIEAGRFNGGRRDRRLE